MPVTASGPTAALPQVDTQTALPETTPALDTTLPTTPTVPTATPALTLDAMLAGLAPSELKALFLKYLGRIGAKGRAKRDESLQKKKDAVISYVGMHGRITHKEVMQLTHAAKTTATRMLASLEKEGRLVQYGGCKARDAYYTIRL